MRVPGWFRAVAPPFLFHQVLVPEPLVVEVFSDYV